MFNSKFRLLIFFFIFFTAQSCVANRYNTETFKNRFHSIKVNYKVAVNNLKYVDKKADYEQYFSDQVLNYAFDCYSKNKRYFNLAEKKYNVSKFVILAVLSVETYCGHYEPKYQLGEVFKTLIELNRNKKFKKEVYKRVKRKYPYIKKDWFNKKLIKKYFWAENQLRAVKNIYIKHKIDLLEVKSSWAGAFGLPQFVPTAFLDFAVDGDGDNKIDLWSIPDAVFSIANYFYKNRWRENSNKKYKIKVIYAYNHSKLYSQTIYSLSELYQKRLR